MRCQGGGTAAEGVDLVPGQVPAPAADAVPRRAAAAPGQQGEADIFHLVEVPDPLQADDQGKDAGQQAAPQRAPRVGEAIPSHRQPVQGLRHQQERARVLRPRGEKGGAGVGTGWPCPTKGTEAGRSVRRGGTGAAPAAPVAGVADDTWGAVAA